jgi:hypothetical protein
VLASSCGAVEVDRSGCFLRSCRLPVLTRCLQRFVGLDRLRSMSIMNDISMVECHCGTVLVEVEDTMEAD